MEDIAANIKPLEAKLGQLDTAKPEDIQPAQKLHAKVRSPLALF